MLRRCVVLAGTSILGLLLAGCNRPDTELAAQREKELATQRAELEQVKASAAALESEVAGLRKDNLELARLRNEVRQLREDKQKLTAQVQTAQSAHLAAQQQAQQAQQQAQQAQQAQQLQAAQTQADQQADQQAHRHVCNNLLGQIDNAKLQWAQENGKPESATPAWQDLAPYFKDGKLPACPAGGVYTLNAVSMNPTCSIPGHSLSDKP